MTPLRQVAQTDMTVQLPPSAPSRVGSTIPSPKKTPATLPEEWTQHQQQSSSSASATWSLEEQVEELQGRLQASMETAEELRRRLASVHGFYERTIRTLQERRRESERRQQHHHRQHHHAETAQEWRAKLDHVKQAKRRAIDALEAKLREKDDEIERLSTLAYDEI